MGGPVPQPTVGVPLPPPEGEALPARTHRTEKAPVKLYAIARPDDVVPGTSTTWPTYHGDQVTVWRSSIDGKWYWLCSNAAGRPTTITAEGYADRDFAEEEALRHHPVYVSSDSVVWTNVPSATVVTSDGDVVGHVAL